MELSIGGGRVEVAPFEGKVWVSVDDGDLDPVHLQLTPEAARDLAVTLITVAEEANWPDHA